MLNQQHPRFPFTWTFSQTCSQASTHSIKKVLSSSRESENFPQTSKKTITWSEQATMWKIEHRSTHCWMSKISNIIIFSLSFWWGWKEGWGREKIKQFQRLTRGNIYIKYPEKQCSSHDSQPESARRQGAHTQKSETESHFSKSTPVYFSSEEPENDNDKIPWNCCADDESGEVKILCLFCSTHTWLSSM